MRQYMKFKYDFELLVLKVKKEVNLSPLMGV
jgi:hypothetical protein